jgi:hypothetical protein
MLRKNLILVVLLLAVTVPIPCMGNPTSAGSSSWWTATVTEENSIAASVLYLPYAVLQIPVRIIDAIVNPCPTSHATVPPAAHRAPVRY